MTTLEQLPAGAERIRAARAQTASLGDAYPFTPHFHAAGGGLLHYIDEGPRDGAALVCLHGNPTWSFYYRNIVRAFQSDLRVVAPDHIGCGLSDKPQDWSYRLADHIENAVALVDALELRDITLLLHDWGGAIGMGLAAARPALIRRLVLLNTAAFPSARMPLRIRACRTPLLGQLAVRGMNAFAGAAVHMAVEKPLDRLTRAGLLLPYDSYKNRIANWMFVQDIPMSPKHPSFATLQHVSDSLAQFRDLPTCILWGEKDWCFSPEFRRMWQQRFPAAEVHKLADAGHYVLEDAPETIVDEMRSFFERHPV